MPGFMHKCLRTDNGENGLYRRKKTVSDGKKATFSVILWILIKKNIRKFCIFKKKQYLCNRKSEMRRKRKRNINIAEWSSW